MDKLQAINELRKKVMGENTKTLGRGVTSTWCFYDTGEPTFYLRTSYHFGGSGCYLSQEEVDRLFAEIKRWKEAIESNTYPSPPKSLTEPGYDEALKVPDDLTKKVKDAMEK